MNQFYVISVSWVPGPANLTDVEAVELCIQRFGDWFRFSASTWLCWTDVGPQALYGALRTALDARNNFLVTAFDPYQWSGWGPNVLEEWINERKLKLISN
ncbi:hypothetical protein [Rhodopseudomonas sp. RCAM05734]|uniref:hypothetical protein n=1 Tax=Rhodopseudomonas sp. RCAM05734 TaxID=3457549 RepID=UPI004044E04C